MILLTCCIQSPYAKHDTSTVNSKNTFKKMLKSPRDKITEGLAYKCNKQLHMYTDFCMKVQGCQASRLVVGSGYLNSKIAIQKTYESN